jgi:hypothetical protein
MSSPPGSGASPRQILVIANETCASQGVVDEVRYRAGEGAEVLVVAPALARSRLDHWLSSDGDRRRADAQARMEASLAAFEAAGLNARGQLGDGDPLQALDDALRVFEPDEVVISTHPHQRSNWLERQVVRRARERYDLPITHVVVDLEHERAITQAAGRPPPEPAPRPIMRVFHASDYDEAIAIRSAGFRDEPAEGARSGVWVTDRPPRGDGGDARVLFAVEVPADLVEGYEQPGPGEERRFLMPAELLNRHGPPVVEGDWSE